MLNWVMKPEYALNVRENLTWFSFPLMPIMQMEMLGVGQNVLTVEDQRKNRQEFYESLHRLYLTIITALSALEIRMASKALITQAITLGVLTTHIVQENLEDGYVINATEC